MQRALLALCAGCAALLLAVVIGCKPVDTPTEETVPATPSAEPSAEPSAAPSAVPGTEPSAAPSTEPSPAPSAAPSTEPGTVPSAAPSTDTAPSTSGQEAGVTVIVGKEEFDAFVASTPIAVIDFSATWCGPCQKLAPYVEKMGQTYAKNGVKIGKIDIDQNQALSRSMNVQSIPDVRIIINGQESDRLVGNNPMELMTKIENAVKMAGK